MPAGGADDLAFDDQHRHAFLHFAHGLDVLEGEAAQVHRQADPGIEGCGLRQEADDLLARRNEQNSARTRRRARRGGRGATAATCDAPAMRVAADVTAARSTFRGRVDATDDPGADRRAGRSRGRRAAAVVPAMSGRARIRCRRKPAGWPPQECGARSRRYRPHRSAAAGSAAAVDRVQARRAKAGCGRGLAGLLEPDIAGSVTQRTERPARRDFPG